MTRACKKTNQPSSKAPRCLHPSSTLSTPGQLAVLVHFMAREMATGGSERAKPSAWQGQEPSCSCGYSSSGTSSPGS